MMKDGISKHNSQLSVLSRAFSPRAIEKSKLLKYYGLHVRHFHGKNWNRGTDLTLTIC